MKLWIMSDLHLELTRGWDLPLGEARPDFDVMVVAGDLVPRAERGVRWLLDRVTDRPVIYVPGNHEFYGCDIDRTVEKAIEAARGTNVHVLPDRAIEIDGVNFIGATLWTDFALFDCADYAMNYAGDVMNDYRKIRKNDYQRRLRPADTLARHRASRNFIATELRKSGRHVIVTHHGPHPNAIRGGCERELISCAYVSDLTDVIEAGRPELWIYGHTHESRDFVVGTTRVITNAKGYGPWLPAAPRWDNPRFDPALIVEI